MNSYAERTLDALDAGDVEQANKLFAWSLRKDDDDTLNSLAEQLYDLGFVKKAQRVYEKLLKEYPDEDQLRINLAEIAIDEDRDDDALNYLEQVKADSPVYLQSLLVAADLYQTQELFEVSEQKLLTAYSLAPSEPVVQLALAEYYFLIRNYAKAIPLYLQLLKSGHITMSDLNIVERLGLAYANDGRFEQAVGYLEQIKPAQMTNDSRFELGFTYLQLKRYADAVKTFKALEEADPQYASLYPYLAQAQTALNQLDEALLTLQAGLGVDQYNENLYLRTAQIVNRLAQPKLAEQYLREALNIDPDNLTIVLELSNLLVNQERYQDNVTLLEASLHDDQIDPQFYWNLAISNDHLENFKAAKDNYVAAMPYFDHNPEFLRPAIYFFREAGMPTEQASALRNYVSAVPDDQEMALMLEDLEDSGY